MNDKSPTRKPLFGLVLRAGGIVLAASCLGLVFNAVRAEGLDLVFRPPTKIISDLSFIPVVEVDDAKELFDQEAVFLDARTAAEFDKSHICCAISVPLDRYEATLLQLKKCGLMKKTVVAYCDGEACGASRALAERLQGDGFEDVQIFFGGWPFWVERGYPIQAEGSACKHPE